MSATLLPNAETQFIDGNGKPLAGGSVYFYIPNTSTPKATWQDPAQTILNTNPVILDGAGRAIIWGNGTYRQVVYDQFNNLVWDQITEDTSAGIIGDFFDNKYVSGPGFTPGTTTQLTLSSAPGSATNVWVFFDGVYQTPDTWSINGLIITFTAPIPVGVQEVNVKVGTTVAIGVPGAGTVTDSSVATGCKLYNRIVDIVDAKDFGAKGNGTNNDTNSLQNAINYLNSIGGGELYVPAGKFMTGALTMYPNIRISGSGDATKFIPSTSGIAIFTIATTAVTVSNCAFRDFQIDAGNVANVTGISSTYYGNIRYTNITFLGCLYNILADRGRGFFVEGIFVSGSSGQKAGTTKFYSSTDTEYIFDIKISKLYILNWGNGTQTYGIFFRRAVGAMVQQYDVNDMNVGNASPAIALCFENDCQGCKAENSIMGACEYMVLIQTGSGVNVAPSFISITDCDCDQNFNTGILIANGNWITINGGMMTTSGVDTAGSGITIQGSSTHIIIASVQFNGWSGVNGSAILMSNCNVVDINGCVFSSCYQGVGIPSNTVTNCLITGCQFDSSVPNPIGGVWTGQTNRAVGNIGFNPQPSVVVPSIPSTGTTITNTNAVDVDVYLSAGTITGINKNGISTGITGTGVVSLAPGDTIGLNYTGTPNWAWIGKK